MDGRQGAIQTGRGAQLGQGAVGPLAHQGAQLAAVVAEDLGLAAGVAVARGNVAGAAALLEELLDHPQGDAETPGDVLPGAFAGVKGGEDAGTQIK